MARVNFSRLFSYPGFLFRCYSRPKAKDTTPEDIKLTGSQVREARIAKGWPQTKLGLVLGVSQKFISLVERGDRPLSLQQAAFVRILLDIKI